MAQEHLSDVRKQLQELIDSLDELDCIPVTAFILDYLEDGRRLDDLEPQHTA